MLFKKLAQATILALVFTLIVPFAYQASLPKTAIAATATGSSVITLNVTTGITINSTATSSTMSQTIGVGADNATASTTWIVRTNNVLGYTLSVNSTSTPAMRVDASTTIPNYVPAVANTPENWTVASGTYKFGYSAFGTRVPTATWGTDTDCNGTTINDWSPTLKYLDASTTARQIATFGATTTTAGDSATVCYAVQQSGSYIPSGVYQATIVATAVTL